LPLPALLPVGFAFVSTPSSRCSIAAVTRESIFDVGGECTVSVDQ
jgi:hypothetical protein